MQKKKIGSASIVYTLNDFLAWNRIEPNLFFFCNENLKVKVKLNLQLKTVFNELIWIL